MPEPEPRKEYANNAENLSLPAQLVSRTLNLPGTLSLDHPKNDVWF